MATKTKMTAGAARSFNRYSVANAILARAGRTCACQPYEDIFTYARWRAQGFQVQRGEHSIKLPVIVERDQEDDDGTITTLRRFGSAPVFCRCQVKAS